MFFRNLTVFRIHPAAMPRMLQEHLEQPGAVLRPIEPFELHTRGFVPPLGGESEYLSHTVDGCTWVTWAGEDRILPASAVNAEFAKRAKAHEEKTGEKLNGRGRKRLREDVLQEMIPKALTKPYRLNAYLDTRRGLAVVDTSSAKQAEALVSALRAAIGTFPALPLNPAQEPRAILTTWLQHREALPSKWAYGDSCLLADGASKGARASLTHAELEGEEVAAHLEAGKQCTRLGLVAGERVSFAIGEDLVVRKLKFLDGAVDALEKLEAQDLAAELDARFVLMTAEIGALFDVLEARFGLQKPEAPEGSPTSADAFAHFAEGVKRSGVKVTVIGVDLAKPGGDRTVVLGGDDQDPLYAQALEHVRKSRRASISNVQRVLKIGYNRAARLIESMETAGAVSAPDARGDRRVLAEA